MKIDRCIEGSQMFMETLITSESYRTKPKILNKRQYEYWTNRSNEDGFKMCCCLLASTFWRIHIDNALCNTPDYVRMCKLDHRTNHLRNVSLALVCSSCNRTNTVKPFLKWFLLKMSNRSDSLLTYRWRTIKCKTARDKRSEELAICDRFENCNELSQKRKIWVEIVEIDYRFWSTPNPFYSLLSGQIYKYS